MTVRLLLVLALSVVAVPGLAGAQDVARTAPGTAALSEHEVAGAARALSLQMREALGTNGIAAPAAVPSLASARAATLARAMLASAGAAIDRPQLVLVVDRAPAVQRLWVMLATPDPAVEWKMLGVVHVSTGKPGKKEHFKTPVGVFSNTPAILGYRAQGTLNEHGIRGNGVKGMRVWDFGWQTTEDWRKDKALTAVRLEMHATDPTFLAGRLGRPDSEACIRIPEKFNQFLDRAGLIDAELLALAPEDRAIQALLPKDGEPTKLAGDKVVVVDSSEPGAVRSDPVVAEEINRRFADFLAQKAALAAAGVPGAGVPGSGVVPAAALAGSAAAGPMEGGRSSASPSVPGSLVSSPVDEPTPVDPVPPLPTAHAAASHAAASPGR
ncbi:MAG: L,D-transpeptidase [Gluconacetobacter diazotrophicus]|nr:L,D-transpeptidase [Gluconacetobacter diazotrophicus]